jgi:hypothetical protein
MIKREPYKIRTTRKKEYIHCNYELGDFNVSPRSVKNMILANQHATENVHIQDIFINYKKTKRDKNVKVSFKEQLEEIKEYEKETNLNNKTENTLHYVKTSLCCASLPALYGGE